MLLRKWVKNDDPKQISSQRSYASVKRGASWLWTGQARIALPNQSVMVNDWCGVWPEGNNHSTIKAFSDNYCDVKQSRALHVVELRRLGLQIYQRKNMVVNLFVIKNKLHFKCESIYASVLSMLHMQHPF